MPPSSMAYPKPVMERRCLCVVGKGWGGGGGAGECKQIVLGYSLLNFLLKPGKEFGVRFY